MLRIRSEQMEILSNYCVRQFEERMFAHIGDVFPEEFEQVGEAGTRQTIRLGVDRAVKHGFETEYDAARYIDLMYLLGPDFDSDPELPWAAEILKDDSYESPTKKMDDLFEEAAQQAKDLERSPFQAG